MVKMSSSPVKQKLSVKDYPLSNWEIRLTARPGIAFKQLHRSQRAFCVFALSTTSWSDEFLHNCVRRGVRRALSRVDS
jgi:hypothetical protein